MRLAFVLAIAVTLGCGRSELPIEISQDSSLPTSQRTQSSQDEVTKRIEAGRLFIDAGRFDEARTVLHEAAAESAATASDKALINALLAKIDSAQSEPNTRNTREDVELSIASPSPQSLDDNHARNPEASLSSHEAEQANRMGVNANISAASESSASDLPAVIERVRPSIVMIVTDNKLGSGFVIDGGAVVTNRHVLEGATTANVQFSDGSKYAVEGIVYDGGELDLCILRCKGLTAENSRPLKVASDPLRQGEGVFAFGAPKGLDFSVSQGIVSANRSIDGVAFVQTTAPISPGNSGGPLLSMLDGAVVGINTWSRVGGQNLNFAIAASHLTAAMREIRDEPLPLNLTNREESSAPAGGDEGEASSLVEMLKARWELGVQAKRQELEAQIAEVREALEAAQSPGARSAYAVRLATLLHERQTLGIDIDLDIPKLHLARIGKLHVGSYGHVQENIRILQVLDERRCLVHLNGIVFLLEDYPTKDLTTDIVLVANRGPIIYVSGTYNYTTKLGAERQVFRIRPAWDAEEFFEELKEKRPKLIAESKSQRDEAIRNALMREWTSSKFRGQAMFDTAYGIFGKFVVKLKRADRLEVRVDLEDLSEQDKQWVADYQRHAQR